MSLFIYLFIYLFVRDKLQDGWTNLNQTFCGDSDYPRIEFRPKRFRLQSKRSEKSPFPLRSAIRSPPLSFTVLDSSAGGKLKKISSHLNLLWWLGLFLVKFKTEIMSVLAKKNRKKSISAPNWIRSPPLCVTEASQFQTVQRARKKNRSHLI